MVNTSYSDIGVGERTEFIRQSWPAQPPHLAVIRSEARRWIAPLPLTEQARYDLIVAIDEAASNAIQHAYPDGAAARTVEVSFWTEPDMVNIEIVDHGRWREPSAGPHCRSRGISLMQRMIESVMIHFDARGTRVLLRHPLSGDAREIPPEYGRPTSLEVPVDNPHGSGVVISPG